MSKKVSGAASRVSIDSARGELPATGAQLQAEFGEFQASERGLVDRFARLELDGDPATAWMSVALVQPGSVPRELPTARAAIAAIEARNAGVHDSSVRSGVMVQFASRRSQVPLTEVLGKLERGEPVDMRVTKFEKISGWGVAAATVLGISVPWLDGVAMNRRDDGKRVKIETTSDLLMACRDAKLI